MDELKIIIRDFKKQRVSKRELIKHLSSTIISIPHLFGYYDHDTKTEFFVEVTSKIEKFISFYKEQDDVKFLTWFVVVLKRDFIRFIKKLNKNENFEVYEKKELYAIHSEIGEEKFYQEKEVKFDLSVLSTNEKKVLFAKFGLSFEEKETSLAAKKIVERMEKRFKYKEAINKKYVRLLRIQKQIKEEHEDKKILL